jgi:hypothetical protein
MAVLVTISAGLSLFLKERSVMQKASATADEAIA